MSLDLMNNKGEVVKQLKEYSFSLEELDVPNQMVEEVMVGKMENASISVSEIIGKIQVEIQNLKGIKGGFVILPPNFVSFEDNGFSCHGTSFNTGDLIASFLKNSLFLVLFVATAGKDFESLANGYAAQRDFLKGYVIDAFGSVIVERVGEKLEELIGKTARESDMNITNRYSPGYCDWNVNEQHKFFSLLPKEFCDVTLTDSAFMVPLKSISGVIGVGKEVKKLDYMCNICEKENCLSSNHEKNR